MIVYDQNGTRIELQNRLGGGGEGSVYSIAGHPRFVAKIYTSDAEAHREKIEAMVGIAAGGALMPEAVAWPVAALYSDAARRSFVGFGMRLVKSRYLLEELHEYPAPSGMRVTMREKVGFLIELCDVLDVLHQMGQVVGDFNGQNVIMEEGGHPALVDTDSFCVRAGGRVFRCEVFNDDIVAPEIVRAAHVSGGGYANCPEGVFSTHADDYALAVHVFRMLMNGVHPFRCTPVPLSNGSVPAPVKTLVRVERGETPFFRKVRGVKVSPSAPELKEFPPYLVELFRRAFVDGHAKPAVRPTAREWGAALKRYRSELVSCRHGHWYWKGASNCPYCAADARYAGAAPGKLANAGGTPQATVPPFAGSGRASRAANGVAAAVQASSPTQAAALGAPYWVVSLLIGSAVFALLGAALPICEMVGISLGVGYPDWLRAAFLISALAGVVAYNLLFVKRAEDKSYFLAGASAVGSMALLALLCVVIAALLGVLLVIFLLGLAVSILSD
ncbi:hypothetical protein [Thermophilibacter sp.]